MCDVKETAGGAVAVVVVITYKCLRIAVVLVTRTRRVLLVSAHLNTFKLSCSHKANFLNEHPTKTL